jgi:hypothetical protein
LLRIDPDHTNLELGGEIEGEAGPRQAGHRGLHSYQHIIENFLAEEATRVIAA